ncbi:MAG: helix-turn-helix domain-containing protein [Actinomycetota bacterium]
MTATRLARAFGAAIRKERESQGLSQEALGDAARLDRRYVSGLERATRNPTLASMEKLAKALGVPLSKLVAEAERSR